MFSSWPLVLDVLALRSTPIQMINLINLIDQEEMREKKQIDWKRQNLDSFIEIQSAAALHDPS